MRRNNSTTKALQSRTENASPILPPVRKNPGPEFVLSFVEHRAKIPEYNSLLDHNLKRYFSNERVQKHLVKKGFITGKGDIVPSNQMEYHRKSLEKLPALKQLPLTSFAIEEISRPTDKSMQMSPAAERRARVTNQSNSPGKKLNTEEGRNSVYLQHRKNKEFVLHKSKSFVQKKPSSTNLSETLNSGKKSEKNENPDGLRPVSSQELKSMINKYKMKVQKVIAKPVHPVILESLREGNSIAGSEPNSKAGPVKPQEIKLLQPDFINDQKEEVEKKEEQEVNNEEVNNGEDAEPKKEEGKAPGGFAMDILNKLNSS